jgi:tetratricopeptide (TPR) repeat protein
VLIGIRGDLSDRLVEIQKALGYSLRPMQVYRLEKFAPEQATNVLKVIAETEGLAFNQQFVLEVARDELAGPDGKVSPVDVQILAQMISREANEANRTFDKQAFQKLGGVDGLLGRSLKRSLDTILSKTEQERTLEVLLALTDLERNVRSGQFSLAQLQKLSGKIRGGPLEVVTAVQWLMDARLITPVEQEGNVAYELAHERLIPALRQVANQELSEVHKANMLLESRVNQWLGSGKQRRYLFGLGELRLLRKHRDFLIWGQQQAQKQELLRRSWRPIRRKLAWIGIPLSLTVILIVWANTPPGQIQAARWGIYNGYYNDPILLEEQNMAISLDMLSEVKNTPFPGLWLRLFAPIENSSSFHKDSTKGFSKLLNIVAGKKFDRKGKQLLDRIISVTDNLENSHVKISLMTKVSHVHFKLEGNEKARENLAQAVKIADSLESDQDKADALTIIASTFTEIGDSEKARQLTLKVLEIINSSQDEIQKSSLFIAVAETYIKINDTENARKLLLRAIETNDSDQSKFQKADDLNNIAQKYIQLNDIQSAKEAFSKAIHVVTTIPQLPTYQQRAKANKIGLIANTSIKLKSTEENRRILLQAIQAAKSIQNDAAQSIALGYIANASTKLNDTAKGEEVIFQILDVVNLLQDEAAKASALGSISDASARFNESEKAKKIISRTFEIAKLIQYKPERIRALGEISKSYVKIGDTEKSQQLIFQALDIAQSIEDQSEQATALIKIARSASHLKDVNKTQETFSKVLDVVKIAESKDKNEELSLYSFTKIAVLGEQAKIHMRMNNIEKAKLSLADAVKIKQKAPVYDEEDAICQVAQLYAELGSWGEAHRLSDSCYSDKKVSVFTTILRVHAEQQNPEFKVLREEKPDEAEE